jgi:lipopolysaccharide transport system permease protein
MNPHAAHQTSPAALVRSLWFHRGLIYRMIKRDVARRYKGSVVGLGWSIFNPILMLSVYTFVFSGVYKARWGVSGGESMSDFAVILFAGLIVYTLFVEVINAAPTLIIIHANFVKKVVFPLEILPCVTLGSALFHTFINIIILLIAFILLNGFIYLTVLLIPLVIAPLLFVILGIGWILASLGVYVRDVVHTTSFITTVMLFLAPIFYPISLLPSRYQVFIHINPLTFIIEQARNVLIFGRMPDWSGLLVYTVLSFLTAWIGYWWFQKTRKGFADVL